ncbi:NAD(P)H-binding protein [Rhodobacterales bacterium HKCCE3408]|nr:NAD(P)H-binding protein [Rhodobacterales bacterium HKCCE3408]
MATDESDKPILVMGATSGIGAKAVEEALSRGLKVRAFSRSADRMEPRDGLETHAGDATEPADVAAAVKGVRAVVYALGIPGRPGMLWEEERLFSTSTRILIAEMLRAGVERIVAVTGFGAGRSKSAMSALEKIGFFAVFRKPYEDKDRQEEMLMDSDLSYTIARPVILTHGHRSGGPKILRRPEEWRNGLVARADVAVYLIDAIEQDLDRRGDVVLAH